MNFDGEYQEEKKDNEEFSTSLREFFLLLLSFSLFNLLTVALWIKRAEIWCCGLFEVGMRYAP